ncbi:MAG: Chemotaxis protein CheY [bacterium ADurb.Bin478]|nr:MAG: Chemotaxis protein CheY [bacterium ADurb.Bin478]
MEQALRLLQTDRFDLLILDLIMESMDSGFTIAYAVRDDERLRDLPILLLTSAQERTGFTFEMERDQEWMKVDEVAAKPLRPTELIERVERLLAKGKRENHG